MKVFYDAKGKGYKGNNLFYMQMGQHMDVSAYESNGMCGSMNCGPIPGNVPYDKVCRMVILYVVCATMIQKIQYVRPSQHCPARWIPQCQNLTLLHVQQVIVVRKR